MSAPVTISDASPAPVDGAPPHVTLPSLYNVFFWIGLFSFGGGLLPWIQREIVTARGWMRNEDFLPGVAMAQILPGVNSVNMAVYVGQRLRGLSGATIAVLGMLTGPFVIMIAAAVSYRQLLGAPLVHAAMAGAAAAAIGMLLRMGLGAVQTAARGVAPVVIMLCVFVAVGVMKWPLLWVVLIATPLSVLAAWPWGRSSHEGAPDA